MATKQYQIQGYINNNVFKGKDEVGKEVWKCLDLRYGDTFNFDTYQEAVKQFVDLWDILTFDEQNNA
jgi:hypothetical protein